MNSTINTLDEVVGLLHDQLPSDSHFEMVATFLMGYPEGVKIDSLREAFHAKPGYPNHPTLDCAIALLRANDLVSITSAGMIIPTQQLMSLDSVSD